MFLKIHLSGDAIVYDKPPKKKLSLFNEQEKTKGRPQGSLYNQQKRSIADACEFLRLYCSGSRDRCAIVFTLTTTNSLAMDADLPRFVSSWFENMRKNYGMGEYVWVREYTKKGIPHFHCVADWWSVPYWFASDIHNRCSNVELISMVWSRLFPSMANDGEASKNSVWLGGYWFRKRIYSLRSKAQCRYLTKYLGKRFTAKRLPMNGGLLEFVRVKDYREVLQSVNASIKNRQQENLRVRSEKRKKK